MIEQLKENEYSIIFHYLKIYFNVDYFQLNPFEKILVYKENKIVGFISYSVMYERAELNYLLVLPEFRNQKIAASLMEKMLFDLIENKIKNITLEVKENNETAIHLYLKYKFKKIAIRPRYYGTIDAILMERSLGD